MATKITYPRISISQDGVWVGSGSLRDGRYIDDCAARLGNGGDDESQAAYDAIESAIAAGLDACECDGCTYEWSVE